MGYLDRMRKDQSACLCPACKRKTRHFTVPSKDGAGLCDIVCEYCGKTVQAGVSGHTPYTPVRIFVKGATNEDRKGKA